MCCVSLRTRLRGSCISETKHTWEESVYFNLDLAKGCLVFGVPFDEDSYIQLAGNPKIRILPILSRLRSTIHSGRGARSASVTGTDSGLEGCRQRQLVASNLCPKLSVCDFRRTSHVGSLRSTSRPTRAGPARPEGQDPILRSPIARSQMPLRVPY